MTITFEVPDALLEDLATSPEELDREICLAAAIHLYSRGLVSQGKGAEIAGLSRWDFIQALTEKADAAFRQAAAKVVELARQTGTPVIVWENGRIVEKSAEEAEMDLRKASTPVIVRDEGRVVETAAEKTRKEPRKPRKGKRKD